MYFLPFFTSKLIKGFDWLGAVNTTEIPQSLALTIPYDYPTQPHLIIVPEPTARSAVPGVSLGRGLLIVHK